MHSPHVHHIQAKLNRTTTLLGLFCVLLVAASVFSFPFPFVRAVWVREVWGLTGLAHTILFLILSTRIAKSSLPAPLVGIGIALNYQILTFRGFFYLLAKHRVQSQDIWFFAVTLAVNLFLTWVFLDTFNTIHQGRFQKTSSASEPSRFYDETDGSALVMSAIAYLILFAMIYVSFNMEEVSRYGTLRILAVLISGLSFGGVGQEIEYYFRGKQSRFFCTIKVLSHLLLLTCVLWIIYRKLPISSVVF